MLRRPKGWKLGSKWVGPYRILKRLEVNYKVISRVGVEKVVHHDQVMIKLCYVMSLFNRVNLFAQLGK